MYTNYAIILCFPIIHNDFTFQIPGFSRSSLLQLDNPHSPTTTSEMTGIERRSAFVPVPSAMHYNSSTNISSELFKVQPESSQDYSSMSYYNHLPHTVPSIPIHTYNRSQVPSHLHQNEPHTPFQLNPPTTDIQTFHPNIPGAQPNNKLLVKVSDSTMIMADVKPKVNKTKARNKRKLDVLSSLTSNILGSGTEFPSYSSDRSDVSKRRKSKSRNDTNVGLQDNNNTQISIKVDSDEEWDINTEENSSNTCKKSPSSSISPSKVKRNDLVLRIFKCFILMKN